MSQMPFILILVSVNHLVLVSVKSSGFSVCKSGLNLSNKAVAFLY